MLTDQNCWCLTSGNSLPVNLNQAQVQKSISFLPTPVARRLPHQPVCVGGVLTAAPEMEGLRERRPPDAQEWNGGPGKENRGSSS